MGHALSRITMSNSSFAITLSCTLPLWPERTTAQRALHADDVIAQAWNTDRNISACARHTESTTSGFDAACAIAHESALTVTMRYV